MKKYVYHLYYKNAAGGHLMHLDSLEKCFDILKGVSPHEFKVIREVL